MPLSGSDRLSSHFRVTQMKGNTQSSAGAYGEEENRMAQELSRTSQSSEKSALREIFELPLGFFWTPLERQANGQTSRFHQLLRERARCGSRRTAILNSKRVVG